MYMLDAAERPVLRHHAAFGQGVAQPPLCMTNDHTSCPCEGLPLYTRSSIRSLFARSDAPAVDSRRINHAELALLEEQSVRFQIIYVVMTHMHACK